MEEKSLSVHCANCQPYHQSSRKAMWTKEKAVKKEVLLCMILPAQMMQRYRQTIILAQKFALFCQCPVSETNFFFRTSLIH